MNRNVPWRTARGGRMLALSQGHNDWYRIKNQASGPTQLHIYDEIGFMGVTANDLISDLADIDGPIDLHLNSPGGEVNDGLAIYNCLLARDGVTAYIDGIAASIASVIAMAADTVRIAPTAQIMVHNPFTGVIGDADDLRAMADRLDENKANIARIYALRTGLTEAHWMDVMSTEGWYRGQEAVDAKLADELIPLRGKGAAASNKFDMSIYNRSKVSAGKSQGKTSNVSWQFDLSDVVQVKPGCEHNPGHCGVNGRVAEVNGNAFGILFDGDDDVHRWYVDNELLLVEEQNQSSNSGPPPMAPGAVEMSGAGLTVRNAALHPYHDEHRHMHEPVTGLHTHNHAAFGHEDHDDGIHHHAHHHNNDADHSHEHYTHDHGHASHDGPHDHAHDQGTSRYGAPHAHGHTHHVGHMYEPIEHDMPGDRTDDDRSAATDSDHDVYLSTSSGPTIRNTSAQSEEAINAFLLIWDAKYSADDRRRMAANGQALSDGSYPIADEEDLHNAIRAVGRGKNNSHSTIRRHIIKRAHAMGKSSMLPEGWTDSGSSPGASDSIKTEIFSEADAAALLGILKG